MRTGRSPQAVIAPRGYRPAQDTPTSVKEYYMSAINILLLAPNPMDAPQLDLKSEIKVINAELKRRGNSTRFNISVKCHIETKNLQRCLLEVKPQIVHFAGHGSKKGIIVENKRRQCAVVAEDVLAEIIKPLPGLEWSVKCVVLNACYTDAIAKYLADSIPCVVGMTSEIDDEAAVQFTSGFYLAIHQGLSIAAAVYAGRRQIALTPKLKPNQWENPRFEATLVDANEFVIRPSQDSTSFLEESVLHGKYVNPKKLSDGVIVRTEQRYDAQLKRFVVVKTLREKASRDSFEKEVADLVRVSKHANIASIYGSWLNDHPPHYVREYVEGESLRKWLDKCIDKRLSIDFVHKVLIALGDAMAYATSNELWDLGIEPETVIIQERYLGSQRGYPVEYGVVICPRHGGSDHLQFGNRRWAGKWSRLYIPPEYFTDNITDPDLGKAQQYRLGLIGYELLIGSEKFRKEARKRSTSVSGWRPIGEVEKSDRCPSFLSTAIEKMINLDPDNRYNTLDEAIDAIAHRKLLVELARDSFVRIMNKEEKGKLAFFHNFYTRLLKEKPELASYFKMMGKLEKPPRPLWQKQFDMLAEGIILLFAFNLLRETEGRTILTRFAKTHFKLIEGRGEYYEHFCRILIETVVSCDKGGEPGILRTAWRDAIEPGLDYFKRYRPTNAE